MCCIKKLIVLIILISNLVASAKGEPFLKKSWHKIKENNQDIAIYFGTISEHYKSMQTDLTGDTNRKLEFTPVSSIDFKFKLYKNLSLIPSVGLVWPIKDKDVPITTTTYFTIMDLAIHYKTIVFRAGPGLFMTMIDGDGSEVELNNGDSTSNFWVPFESSTSINHTLNLSLEFFSPQTIFTDTINDRFSTKLSGHVYTPFDKGTRTISLALMISYHFSKLHSYIEY